LPPPAPCCAPVLLEASHAVPRSFARNARTPRYHGQNCRRPLAWLRARTSRSPRGVRPCRAALVLRPLPELHAPILALLTIPFRGSTARASGLYVFTAAV